MRCRCFTFGTHKKFILFCILVMIIHNNSIMNIPFVIGKRFQQQTTTTLIHLIRQQQQQQNQKRQRVSLSLSRLVQSSIFVGHPFICLGQQQKSFFRKNRFLPFGITTCTSFTQISNGSSSTNMSMATTTRTANTTLSTRPFNKESIKQSSKFENSSPLLLFQYKVYVAVGSNMGDRYGNIRRALDHLFGNTLGGNLNDDNNNTTQLVRTSYLYETAPMYLTDQPPFLNGVIELHTNDDPPTLLKKLKDVEVFVGRNLTQSEINRYGPRPVDLDILFYYNISSSRIRNNNNSNNNNINETTGDDEDNAQQQVHYQPVVWDSHNLTIPHPRIEEREFVLLPLLDLVGKDSIHPISKKTFHVSLLDVVTQRQQQQNQEALTEQQQQKAINNNNNNDPVRVIPLPRNRFLYFNETLIMGILNVTPDSFSDGGMYDHSIQNGIERALQMIQEGVTIIDIGGESTRPGAKEVFIDEELNRTIPIIEGIRKVSDIPISIDTRHAIVAKAAILAGADIVNDVSGGTFDSNMFRVVGELGVPMILMHMRGTPETMQTLTKYHDVVMDVATTLQIQSDIAEQNGILRWGQIIDPGIGFAKDLDGNIQLLRHLSQLRLLTNNLPLLLGTSRKGFIGTITNEMNPKHRDPGTIASCVASICLDHPSFQTTTTTTKQCNIIRVHNVIDCKQAMMVMDAIRKR